MIKRLGLFLNILLFIGSSAIFAQVAPDCVTAVPICNNTPVNGGTNGFGVDDFGGDAAHLQAHAANQSAVAAQHGAKLRVVSAGITKL